MKTLLLALSSIGGLLAQSTPPNQLQIYSPAPSPVRQIGGGTVGQSGSTTLYYWVIARYSSGIAVNTTPVAIFNTVGTANLTASNYVSITWGAVGGATGYDVLRSTTPIYPANPTCTGCAVSLNTPNSSVADTGAALSDYPPGGLVQSSSTTATIYLDNSNSVPYLNTQLLYRATENLIVGLISGSIANGDCLEYSNGRIVSAGAACGSGSGGASLPYPGIAVGLTSSTSIARSLIGSDSSISITNPDGTTGNPDLSVNTGIISSREQVQLGSSIYALTTGTSTAYLCGLTPAATVGFLANGTSVRLKIDETSGAAPVTLSCDGSTAKAIYKRNGTTAATQVTTGELIADQIYNFDYDTSLNAGAGGWLTDIGGGGVAGLAFSAITAGTNAAALVMGAGGTWRANAADATAPNKSGTSLPGTCSVGDTYLKTDAVLTQVMYTCSTGNVWTQQQGTITDATWFTFGGMDPNNTIGTHTALQMRFYEFTVFAPGKILNGVSTATGSTGGYFAVGLYNSSCALIAQTETKNIGTFDDDEYLAFSSAQTLTPGKYYFGIAEQAGTGLMRSAYGYTWPTSGRSSSTYGIFYVSGTNATFSSPNLTVASACTGTRVAITGATKAPFLAGQ